MDLYAERVITLQEALCGFRLVIEHLDGRKLLVQSRPGEIVRPRNLLPDAEAEWDRFDNTDVFPHSNAAQLKTNDLEACKELCRQRNLNGFVYWEDTAFFRSHSRSDLLEHKKHAKGATLFVQPDSAKSAAVRTQRAVRGAGMPAHHDPTVRGNLFVLLKVELPSRLREGSAELLREVLAPLLPPSLPSEEDYLLSDLDPVESARQHHKATGYLPGWDTSKELDEAAPVGSPGPPPCPQM